MISTVYKLYLGVLNNRLNNDLEFNGVLLGEQKGFRENGAYIDYIFVMTSVVRTRLGEGKIVCFAD